jgi:hypothetical protein
MNAKYLRSIIFTAIIAVVLAAHSFTVQAASPQESVYLEYLYINKKLITGTDKKITLYREMLPGGILEIAGKGKSNAPIAKIEVSTDDQATWKENTVSTDGTFRMSIKTEMGMNLRILIRVTDAKGNVNDVNAACQEIFISKMTLNRAVREALDGLMGAFMENNAGRFMSYFSEDYVGDKSIYDRKMRRRSGRANNMDIRYSVNNITPDSTDKVSASFNFNRRYTAIRTGTTVKNSGVATIIFRVVNVNGDLKVYSIRGKSPF